LAMDPGFAAMVRTWERRLGELNVLVSAVEPPPEVWGRIQAGIAGMAQGGEAEPPARELPPEPSFEAVPAAPAEPTLPQPAAVEDRGPHEVRLQRRVRRWRAVALMLLLIAA